MKKLIIPVLLICMATGTLAQSGFSPEAYLEFVEQNRSLTAGQLLIQHPPKTTYYSDRQYKPDLGEISYFDSLDRIYNFTADEKELLKKNYFMVTERLTNATWDGAFVNIYGHDLPLFLSTDFILFTLHQSYDEILKGLEVRLLEPNLKALLAAMYAEIPALADRYAGYPELNASLEDADLFVSVARSLLEGSNYPPWIGDDSRFNMIMQKIGEENMAMIPLFTGDTILRKVDFSQFKPRGHYTDLIYLAGETVTLENYFRAMTWLGRIGFFMTDPPENAMEGLWNPDECVRMSISALLLNELLQESGKKNLLDTHEEILGYLVGESDNLTPGELAGLEQTFLDSPVDLLDPVKYAVFSEALAGSDDYGQKIMSNFFYCDLSEDNPADMPVSFRLMGQKFILDSYIFHHVVYDRIIYEDRAVWRPMPDPLDILSVLGNENAMALMELEMEAYHYAYKVNELLYLVNSYDDDFWTSSLYNSWLAAIRDLNPPVSGDGLPYFMQTTAWHHEKLNTQLTSWAQLRHDNILYAKQSYTGGTSCSFPYTYVEPYPNFYRRLAGYATDAAAFYTAILDGKDDAYGEIIGNFYTRYAEIMHQLESIAGKALSRTPLNEDEVIFLKTMINDYMASGPSISGWLDELYFPAFDKYDFDYTVADVHTQPTDFGGAVVGNVLHVGNGRINLGVFIAPSTTQPDNLMCYVGPVGSFHTEVTKNFVRYTDIEWQKKFMEGTIPSRPGWVRHYLADGNGHVDQPAHTLKGVLYTGTQDIRTEKPGLGYLLTYPNPVEDMLRIRFITDAEMPVKIEIYDLSGRLLSKPLDKTLVPAEHSLAVPAESLGQGIFILKTKAGDQVISRRFVVK